ncbi:MAG: T9SS type A sorting domain-containing protein [Bacteroidales bacterium]|nr:T9SS type A sorting domain-containing protein [Bacteroidales bacterium]
MKKHILFVVLLFTFNAVFAQKNTVQLVSSGNTETILTFKLNSFDFKDVKTPVGNEIIVISEDLTQILQKGSPDLPKFTQSVIIPDLGNTNIEVISSEFYEIEDINIAPSKGNFSRDIDPSTVPYEYGEVYSKDAFFPNQIANADKPYIVRDFRGQAVHVYPFTYNPVKNIIRVYTEITIKVVSGKEKGENEFNRTKSFDKVDREFNIIYSNHFINYENQTKYTPVEEEGNMLIICYDDWTDQVQPLVNWKNTIGRSCEMVTVTETGGTTSEIKTYVENYYNTNGLAYLLLIGDAAQIPTNSGGFIPYGDSDNAYAYISGDDHYLEFFVGRFSAETTAHVETQVLRTIEYEKGDQLADGWLNKLMSVGSDQGPGDDNEYDYEHLRNMQTDLFGFTYVEPPYEHFDGSQGGNDAPGNPSPSDVAASLNSGLGIANYTGHGSTTAWGSSDFSVSDINNLTNDNKLPFIWSVACLNGNFVGNTCFGEAWLRAEHNGEPTGGIAVMASTMNQSWSPPMAAQDEMVDLLVESYTENIKRTFAGISINGCFLMNDEYPGSGSSSSNNSGYTMTDTWTCFGDPSLLVRTDNPADMVITHNDTILFGSPTFTVNCDYNNALACISKAGVLIGTDIVEGGVAEVPIDGVDPGDEVTLSVTGFNKVTYLTDLTVIAPSGPYVIVESFDISGGTTINYGQTRNINITLQNVGPEEATSVTATLTTTDEYVVSLTNNTDVDFGDIAGDNGTATSSGNFTLTVADNIPDQYIISFDLDINSSNKTSWEGQINVTANAPVPQLALNGINDAEGDLVFTSTPVTAIDEGAAYNYDISVLANGGNDNGMLDAGETVGISVNAGNAGHASFVNAICTLSSTSEYVTVNTSEVNIGTIAVGQTFTRTFSITIDESTPTGTTVDLTFTLVGGEYSEEITVNLSVGLQIEDFETGDFSSYAWTFGGSADWLVQENTVYEGTYSAVSGDIGNSQTSDLVVTIDVTEAAEISFWYNLSSEENWDELHFYIDGNEVNEYNAETWTEVTEPITAGVHTLKWAYEKDGSVSEDDDCVYLDLITFPGHTATKGMRSITITAPTIPDWLSLTDNGDGTGVLSGTAPNEGGLHDVVIEAQAGGDPVPQPFTINVGGVSVDVLTGDISIFPNPNNGIFNIDLQSLSGIADVKIQNINGQVIYQSKTSNNILEVDITNYAKGVYFVSITSGNEVYNSKIILQ